MKLNLDSCKAQLFDAMYLEMYNKLHGHIAVSASKQTFPFDELEASIRHFYQYLHAEQLDMNAEPEDDDTMVLYGRSLARYIRKSGISVAEPLPKK